VSSQLQTRAGRYTPHRERPELCDRAAQELGLTNVVYRRFPEGEFVAGDRNGDHLLFCARTFAPIRPAPVPLGERAEQGRLDL
jgi:hypothetical protein